MRGKHRDRVSMRRLGRELIMVKREWLQWSDDTAQGAIYLGWHGMDIVPTGNVSGCMNQRHGAHELVNSHQTRTGHRRSQQSSNERFDSGAFYTKKKFTVQKCGLHQCCLIPPWHTQNALPVEVVSLFPMLSLPVCLLVWEGLADFHGPCRLAHKTSSGTALNLLTNWHTHKHTNTHNAQAHAHIHTRWHPQQTTAKAEETHTHTLV
mmetsp:Transcript_14038/g.22344  ORF Transcript_14038/g.22344 Transcript_14038/m.22344 type:complete len:207 (-) Transcript_14038:503-1123(-)